MIYTVTLSPSIDYVVRLASMRFNVTNRTDSEEFYYGGKGINVSLILSELDLDSTALGFIAGFTGDAIAAGIQNARVRTEFIRLNEGFSRINIKIKAGGETEINGQGPDIPPEALEELMRRLDRIQDGDVLVLAGSIPRTLPDDVYERMLDRVSGKRIMIVVDATKSCWSTRSREDLSSSSRTVRNCPRSSTLRWRPPPTSRNMPASCRRWARATCWYLSAARAPSSSMRTARPIPPAC